MADDRHYLVAYPGELTDADEQAFDRAGLTYFRNSIGAGDPFWRAPDAPADAVSYQVVRVWADSPEAARRQVVDALGREPAGLEIGT